MKTVELIEILTKENQKVKVLKNPLKRFLIWVFFSFLSLFVILFFTKMVRGQYHIPQFWESNITLVIIIVGCGFVLFKRNIPGNHSRYDYVFHNLILVSWLAFLFFSVSNSEKGLFTSLSEEWKNHGTGCVEIILLMTLIPIFLLNFYLKKGFVEPTILFQSSVYLLPFALAQFGISFFCPNESSIHILTWHTLTLIPFYSLVFFSVHKLF